MTTRQELLSKAIDYRRRAFEALNEEARARPVNAAPNLAVVELAKAWTKTAQKFEAQAYEVRV